MTAHTLQRSVTFRGCAVDAEAYRAQLAAEYTKRRAVTRAAPMLTVAEVLQRWLSADNAWKPSTDVGGLPLERPPLDCRSPSGDNSRRLVRRELGRRR